MVILTILLIPTVSCNFKCAYCFEDPSSGKIRDISLNLDAMENTLSKLWEDPYYHGSGLGVHGGECLLMDPLTLDRLFNIQHKYTGESSIVTNGSLINNSLIRLFKKYNTRVSISIDGPPEFNLLRGPNPYDEVLTVKYNELINKNIGLLRKENIGVSVMCIINKINSGTYEKICRMKEWFEELSNIGITGGRINPMYTDGIAKQYELTNEELLCAYLEYANMTLINSKMRWLPFREMVDNLLGFSSSPCIFGGCDYLHTQTVVIYPDGSLGNCDRTFSEGVGIRSETGARNGRPSALSQTQCIDCNYWQICHGGCPCEGKDGDWRNKTRFCEAISGTYDFIAERIKGLLPNIRFGDREPFGAMSWNVVDRPTSFGNYKYKQIQQQSQKMEGGPHVDLHGDEHGDKPHGDHNDESGEVRR